MLYTEYALDDRLQRALATAGFVTPTPIQAAALPVAMDGRDLVGTAQTGTGKTAAFVLPILQQLIGTPLEMRKTRAVILAPTRELVEQILAVVRELGVHTNVRAVAVYGGVAMQPQTRALRNGVELVIACPGRLLDHIKRRNVDFRQLDCLVLDEADRMLDMGFLPAIQEIIDYLPTKRQTMLYSATFPKTLNAFVKETLCDPVRVEVDTAVPAQTVHHTLYQVKGSMKTNFMTSLLRQLAPESDSVLIFTRTRVTANQLVEHLHDAGMQADVLHAEKTQRARQDTLDRFRSGVFPYLVATDVAARGIDVTSISHVINYDLPTNADDYLHRIGRTGRMERSGHAISLMTRGDIRALREIERMLGKKIEVAQLEGGDFHQQMHDAGPTRRAEKARPPKPQVAAHHATNRPSKPHQQREAEASRRAPRSAKFPKPSQRTGAPSRGEYTGKRRAEAAPDRADRPQRQRYADAPSSRNERSRHPFGNEGATGGRIERPERGDRRRRDGEAAFASKRRERAADNRFADAPSGAPRQERPSGKPFTGTAAAAKYHRKHAPGRRQPGEVPSGARPTARPGPAHQSTTMPTTRKKRPAGRRR